MGKLKIEAPKLFTCVAFTSPAAGAVGESSGLCDLVSGANNGAVFLWRLGICVRSVQAIGTDAEAAPSVDCLQVHRGGYRGSDLIYCGGAGESLLAFVGLDASIATIDG